MNYRERILAAINHQPLDRFPVDIWCVEEVRERLLDYCGTQEWVHVLDALEIDGIISLRPPYQGPALPDLGEELRQDEWGMVYKRQEYPTGVYWEQVGYPLAQAKSIADIDAYSWPDPDWYDYSALPDLCALYENRAIEIGYTAIFYYHNKLRGLELSLMDLALRPKFSHHLIRRIADFFLAYHERCFTAAQGLMHITQVTDDFGSQKGLLISKEMFNEFYRPWIQRAIDQAKRYGLKVFHHDDGAIYPLIPDLIEMGIDVLNPIQWRCPGMERETLSREFAGKVCFHGGVDNQYTLPFSSPDQVRQEVAENICLLGRTGTGYILAPCHNIQANTPLENILAMYQAPRTLEEARQSL
ncbi:MAG: uroporphyrinogen-III decarboxylase-like protein [Anaerolineae bacterium]|nr:uroporphyrinogen-III decarboxylase-like protein [Anaerolineae bacterium]